MTLCSIRRIIASMGRFVRFIACHVLLLSIIAFSQQPQWRVATGTANTPIAAIDIYRSNPDTMYALGAVSLMSTDNGATWDTIPTGPIGTNGFGALRVDPYNFRIIYASHFGFAGNNVSMSIDGGLTWRLLFIGEVLPANVVELSPLDHRIVYVGVGPGDIWRSTNQGKKWTRLPLGPAAGLTSLAIDPVNDSVLYAGHLGALLKSTDWGATWQQLNLGFQWSSGTTVAVDPSNRNVVYATVYSSGTGLGGVFKSTDAGLTWAEKNNGLDIEHRRIQAFAINPSYPENLLVGIGSIDNNLIYRSTNGGGEWVAFANGLPDSGHVESIAFDTLNNRVFIGVGAWNASGVYVLDGILNVDIIAKQIPAFFALHQNYPNPFNASTVIAFEIPQRSRVSISIYDVLGQELSRLVDDERGAGSYSVAWDAFGVASGVYFAVMKSEVHTATRKIVLIK